MNDSFILWEYVKDNQTRNKLETNIKSIGEREKVFKVSVFM